MLTLSTRPPAPPVVVFSPKAGVAANPLTGFKVVVPPDELEELLEDELLDELEELDEELLEELDELDELEEDDEELLDEELPDLTEHSLVPPATRPPKVVSAQAKLPDSVL